MPQIFCLGHSITYGRWDIHGGWTQRLRKELDQRSMSNQEEEDFQIWNLGIPGEDTSQLLERIEPELEKRIYEEMEQIIIVQIGANDIQQENGKIRIPEEKFRENLEKILEKSQGLADKVIMISEAYTEIEGTIPWAPEKKLSDDRLQKYVEIQRETVKENNTPFIDLREKLTKQEWQENLEDGIHPNAEGHQKILNEVKQKLAEENII